MFFFFSCEASPLAWALEESTKSPSARLDAECSYSAAMAAARVAQLLFACLCLRLSAAAPAPPPLALHLLADPAARCLDGSSAGYYYRAAAAANSTLWVVYMEGGGACYSYADCLARSKTDLGSSARWSPTLSLQDNVLSSDAAVNPTFSGAHHVYIPYCSGDVHSGTRAGPLNATWPFTFAGHLIVAAVLDALAQGPAHAAAFAAAQEILVSGSSAGGLGTLYNADYIASRVPRGARVRAAPQGGWFFPGVELFQAWAANGGAGGPPIWRSLAFARELYAGYAAPACAAAFNDSFCASATNLFPFTAVPTFVAENLVDSQQVYDELLAPPASPQLPAFLAYFHAAMRRALALVSPGAGHALWAPGCFEHTDNLRFAAGNANQTLVQGHSFRDALTSWWLGGSLPRVLQDACGDPVGKQCNPTCPH